MQSQAKHALVTQERDLNTYAELWDASECGPLPPLRAAFLWAHQCCAVATAAALVIDPGRRCHVLVTVWGCAWGRGQAAAVWRSTGAIMGNVVYDFLLFSCMALVVTGIVLAAASLLI